MKFLASLTGKQKEAVALLQAGTFLEYFDLLLYVHMAVLLNSLFFPKTDPHTEALLSAFAFCSSFILRPFGAVIFGYIGDHIGRKPTVVITTILMAVSCIVMANLPTYAQIGISAAWVATACRILQGLSSMGERVGAEIYLTEMVKSPLKYPLVAFIPVFADIGSMMALVVASLVTLVGFNWRVAFWIGACIAIIGSVARTRLREAPEFSDMKRRVKRAMEAAADQGIENAESLFKNAHNMLKEKVNKKTAAAFFLIYCGYPACFYFIFIYCANFLKNNFAFTPEQIIHHNLIVSIVQLITCIAFALLSYKVHPLKILKARVLVFLIFIAICPYLLNHVQSSVQVLMIQSFILLCLPTDMPANPVFIKYFPIFKRFTAYSLLYAISRALMYIITSFALVYLTEYWGHLGLLIIMLPIGIGYLWGVIHFEDLEEKFEHLPEGSFSLFRSMPVSVSNARSKKRSY